MREQIRSRIESLRVEYRTGQEMLADLEGRQAGLKVTLTRISGAIQVLEELLHGSDPDAATAKTAADGQARAA